MKPFAIEDSTSPRTDALIDEVMARHPTDHLANSSIKRALARYYEDVHQELAPLCRELEAENRALRVAMCLPKLKLANLRNLASSPSDAETISRTSATTTTR
jgi:hypothetical protein